MHIRILTVSALAMFLASPAFADCQQEVSKLDETVIAAETGAETAEGGMPATVHQEQVLGENQTKGEAAGASADTASVEAVSPHQREVLREVPDKDRTQATAVLSEARDMATAGNEQGCMDKLAEVKTLLGINE
jgi:hypothetical protein